MAFRYPRSSDRQPGIEEANTRTGIESLRPTTGRQYQGIQSFNRGNPHMDENIGYSQMMQNQFPFYEDRIVDVARRNDPMVGAMLEQMYDQNPYREYGQLGDNFKPNITVDFLDSGTPFMGPDKDISPMNDEVSNLETEDILRIMGQYGVDETEARRIYDETMYGYERDIT
jgi:hypothetical protein